MKIPIEIIDIFGYKGTTLKKVKDITVLPLSSSTRRLLIKNNMAFKICGSNNELSPGLIKEYIEDEENTGFLLKSSTNTGLFRKILGFVLFKYDGNTIHIDLICVDNILRKKTFPGVSLGAILLKMVEHSKRRGTTNITLDSLESAESFYRRQGFRGNGRGYDTQPMIKYL